MTTDDNAIRLLLVDDETEFLESASRALRRRGFDVQTAADGQAALDLLSRHGFDVAVLDVKMPGLDGTELFRRIHDDRPELPVVMLTGHGNPQHAFETSRDGVVAYLTKPCDIDQLSDTLRQALSRGTASRSRKAARTHDETERVRLLLVDDEEELVASLYTALGRRGMDVTTATSGAEALEILGLKDFDVVVLDVKMPGLDGLEVLRRGKALRPTTEFLLLTGHPSVTRAVQGIRDGAFDYLSKPYEVDDLAQRIREARRAREAHVAVERDGKVRSVLEDRPVD